MSRGTERRGRASGRHAYPHAPGGPGRPLLTFAIGEGGLGAARANYTNDMVADAGTAIFTITAGGMTKTVSVYALGIETQATDPDTLARAAFGKLAERLGNFDQNGAFPTQEYAPERYRGILLEGMAGDPAAKKWPRF